MRSSENPKRSVCEVASSTSPASRSADDSAPACAENWRFRLRLTREETSRGSILLLTGGGEAQNQKDLI